MTFAEAGGVRLCVQTFGDPCDPAILLISGMSASIDWWDEDFCARLAAGLRYVIRYDHRDTGQSACYPPGAPSYTGGDLAADAVAVLDALRVDTAHLVGISMGGAIAQRLALERRGRVATLTLISTTAIGPTSPDSPELPPPSPELSALPEPVPLENTIRQVTCRSSGRQAAYTYSLIRPLRTGFRRICRVSTSVTVAG